MDYVYIACICAMLSLSFVALNLIWWRRSRRKTLPPTTDDPNINQPISSPDPKVTKDDVEQFMRRVSHLHERIDVLVKEGKHWYDIYTSFTTAYGKVVAATVLGDLFKKWMSHQDTLLERQRAIFRERDRMRFRNMPTHAKVQHYQKTRPAPWPTRVQDELTLYRSIQRSASAATFLHTMSKNS